MGYLGALEALGLLGNARYLGGTSGGSWGVAVATYASMDIDDVTLFGQIMLPQDMTMANLGVIGKYCARNGPVANDFVQEMLYYVADPFCPNRDAWMRSVEDVFFDPVGVPIGGVMAWNQEHVADIISRNPSLSPEDFVLPRSGRPFPIFAITGLGPFDLMPFNVTDRTYNLIEATPLYSGEVFVHNVTYSSSWLDAARKRNGTFTGSSNVTLLVGGQVESFAFGSSAPSQGINGPAGMVQVTAPAIPWSLSFAASASSWAPGDMLGEFSEFLSRDFDPNINVWSPASPNPITSNFGLGDGGDMENPHLIGMLQRKVSSIVIFCNFYTALNTSFDPYAREPTQGDLDDDVSEFFGYQVDPPDQRGYDITRNQVFAKADFPRFFNALRYAALNGTGMVVTTELTTVANTWWGIQAGFTTNITWVYLGRVLQFEALLPSEIRSQIQPKDGASNPTNLVSGGQFNRFPNFYDNHLQLSAPEANLLADMSAWVVLANADAFRTALAPTIR